MKEKNRQKIIEMIKDGFGTEDIAVATGICISEIRGVVSNLRNRGLLEAVLYISDRQDRKTL